MVFKEDMPVPMMRCIRTKTTKRSVIMWKLFSKIRLPAQDASRPRVRHGRPCLDTCQKGYQVTGVDRSAAMLELAKKKSRDRRLDIEFIEGDLTRISTGKKYDAVISLFAVMGYQTTNAALAAACKVAKGCLVPGGMFLFDCWHALQSLR